MNLARDNTNAFRDLSYLDICLESYLRMQIERIGMENIKLPTFHHILNCVLQNLKLIVENEELHAIYGDWTALASSETEDDALHMHAVLYRITRYMGSYID